MRHALIVCSLLRIGGHETGIKLDPPDALDWKDGPASLPKGAKIAVLEGDPSKEGPFVFRVKVPDGYRIPVHTHPKTERVTVMSGTADRADVIGLAIARSQCVLDDVLAADG